MSKSYPRFFAALAFMAIFFYGCSEKKTAGPAVAAVEKPNYYGYETQALWGEYLVATAGCTDCHTPKKMTPMGPVDDSTLFLSGHPEKMPAPDVNRKEMESKGLIVTQTFTAWVGPWGISYAANLTPDETGIGNWTEEQFIYAIQNSTTKGLPGARPMLPPMALMPFKLMKVEELKAIFAYLRTIKPIKNISVQPTPPALSLK
jgi:hypothetical protein